MFNFSRVSKNLIGVSVISTLMVFWLGSRYLFDAYTQYSDATQLQRSVGPEITLFELSHRLNLERDEIQRVLVTADQFSDELGPMEAAIESAREQFEKARHELLQSVTDGTLTEQHQFSKESIDQLIKSLEEEFRSISFSNTIISRQINLPREKRDEYVRLQMYDAYNSLIVVVNNVRKNINVLPDKSYTNVLAAHNVKNSIWNLSNAINQISTLVETYLLKHKLASIDSLNVDNIAFRIFQQHERATQAFSILTDTVRSGEISGVTGDVVTEFQTKYESVFQTLSKQHILSTPAGLDPSVLLEEWQTVSSETREEVQSLKDSALSNTVLTAASIKRDAIKILFINTFLVWLCVVMAYATYRIAKRIQHQADHDELTRMPNRRYFNNMLVGLFRKTDIARQEKLILMTMDLNGFKSINDTMGHIAGDDLLTQVAERLTAKVSEDKVLARMGGDEFAIAYHIDPTEDPYEFASQIRDTFDRSFNIEDGMVKIDISIGYSVYPDDASTLKELQITSDFAMFSAKQSGRKIIQPYDREIANKFENRIAIEKDLVIAIENDELELLYQPQFDLKHNEANAVEALIRWNHPIRGVVSPVVFIEVAEETGLMPAIGSWVLNEACRQAAVWNNKENVNIRVAVNVSVHQVMQSGFVQEVFDTLERHRISASCLELEITESVVIADIDWIVKCLNALKVRGVRIALDDFGTGYSSLSQLQKLPLDTLKIDRSFICGLEDETKSMKSVTATIASIAEIFDLETVAEGIETEAQLFEVRQLGIDIAQGYYYSRPVPRDDVVGVIYDINERASGIQKAA